jgi:predicted AAA+ superfamily ATPase
MEIREYLATKKEDVRSIRVEERLKEVKENRNFVVSIVGPRRSGKTYYLYNLIKKVG